MYENRLVIVTLTTIPSRLAYIEETLISILKQTIKPDEIVLSLPIKSIREPNLSYEPSDNLKTFCHKYHITILRCEKDYGPATKLLGLLSRELDKDFNTENDPLIITFDDDKYYECNCIQQLLDGWKRNENCVVARKGAVLIQLKKTSNKYLSNKQLYDRHNRYHEILFSGATISKDQDVSIIFGTGGILYRLSFFDKDILNYSKVDSKFPKNEIFYIDDVFLSGYIGSKNIIKKVIKFSQNETTKLFDNKVNKSIVLDLDTKNRKINPLIDINKKAKNQLNNINSIKYFEKYLVKL